MNFITLSTPLSWALAVTAALLAGAWVFLVCEIARDAFKPQPWPELRSDGPPAYVPRHFGPGRVSRPSGPYGTGYFSVPLNTPENPYRRW